VRQSIQNMAWNFYLNLTLREVLFQQQRRHRQIQGYRTQNRWHDMHEIATSIPNLMARHTKIIPHPLPIAQASQESHQDLQSSPGCRVRCRGCRFCARAGPGLFFLCTFTLFVSDQRHTSKKSHTSHPLPRPCQESHQDLQSSLVAGQVPGLQVLCACRTRAVFLCTFTLIVSDQRHTSKKPHTRTLLPRPPQGSPPCKYLLIILWGGRA
jgi:hypothetical protein